MKAPTSFIGRAGLFCVCYIPASYILMLWVFLLEIAETGDLPVRQSEYISVVFAPVAVLVLVLMCLRNWSDGFMQGNWIGYLCFGLLVVWGACFWALLSILQGRTKASECLPSGKA